KTGSYITRPLSRQVVGRCFGMGFTPRPGLDSAVVKQRTFSGQDPRGRLGDPRGSSGIVAGGGIAPRRQALAHGFVLGAVNRWKRRIPTIQQLVRKPR